MARGFHRGRSPAHQGGSVESRPDSGRAVVTGGASGIGLKTCQALARRGYAVAVADLNVPGAAEVADAIKAAGGQAQAFELDPEHPESVTAMRAAVVEAM